MIQRPGRLSRLFRETLAGMVDLRLEALTQGLGVISGSEASYYPMDRIPLDGEIEDAWPPGVLIIQPSSADGVPAAHWEDTPDRPMQLLTRWYGFSFTYPDCKVYQSVSR